MSNRGKAVGLAETGIYIITYTHNQNNKDATNIN